MLDRDNLHGFLDQCFSRLLKAVFGYDGPSWLNIAAKVPRPWTFTDSIFAWVQARFHLFAAILHMPIISKHLESTSS